MDDSAQEPRHLAAPMGFTPRPWLLTFAAATILYACTAQRSVGWQDSGFFQWRVLTGAYHSDGGMATAHPLYIAAGQAVARFPIGSFCWRLNALSGVGMAVALANLVCLAALLTSRRWVGPTVAAMLAVAHTVWWLSTIAEVYTWVVAGLTAEIWLLALLLRRPSTVCLTGLALTSGLGWATHNFALLPLPVYLIVAVSLVVRRKLPWWSLIAAAAAYLIGAGLYLGMIVNFAVETGDGLGAVASALFGNHADQVTNIVGHTRFLKANLALSAMNFVNLLLPLALLGWVGFRRRLGTPLAAALGAVTLIHLVFFVRYPVPDQFTFILPLLVMIAIAAMVGLDMVADANRRWRISVVAACVATLAAGPLLYAAAPHLVRRLAGNAPRARELPFRNELRYWLVPWKHNERSAQQFTHAALAEATPHGVIMADGTSDPPLRLVHRMDNRYSEITIQCHGGPLPSYQRHPRAFRRELGDRPLYAVAPLPGHVPARLLRDANFTRQAGAVLYRAILDRPRAASKHDLRIQ